MTQDQYSQARGPGYVVRGEAVPDDENEEFPDGESKPMTRFQKVASALRGGPERDEQDQADEDELAADPVTADHASGDQAAVANSPISRDSQPRGDYWDETAASAADRDEAVAVTSPGVPVSETGTDPLARQDQEPGQAGPDAMDHPPTQPDMFGTTTHADSGATSASYLEDHADSPTLPDGPANGTQANGIAASGVPMGDVPAGGVPAGDVPAGGIPPSGVAAGGVPASGVPASGLPAGEATGTAGRHAATTSGDTESRPGEATGALGDFSDLSYGDLLPDATQYTSQWQQIQFKFVDDPQASVTEAADVIAQVTSRLEAAIQERQRAIEERQRAIAEQQRSLRDRWGEGTNADTEALRATLRLYKTFLDQLIGPRAG